eukprot:CAMPEP_0177727530 /NCGR_PEP_ID=MMETSP0484_2-20121128/20373_1 /TAXON_ID=354590 /ORGANISM="Rhodomonas lens, Strain RHODO" /LENGTH=84 /DNA_ID=CAMNT_0019240195 /DNA_START=269 /DNA_END=520 /DNA_ORIENTATION=+
MAFNFGGAAKPPAFGASTGGGFGAAPAAPAFGAAAATPNPFGAPAAGASGAAPSFGGFGAASGRSLQRPPLALHQQPVDLAQQA